MDVLLKDEEPFQSEKIESYLSPFSETKKETDPRFSNDSELKRDYYQVAISLVAHERKKVDSLPCAKCGTDLRRKHHFEMHIQSHLSSPLFRCELCSKKVVRFDKHVAKYHSHMKLKKIASVFKIRPEMAEEALDNLESCLPGETPS